MSKREVNLYISDILEAISAIEWQKSLDMG